MNTCLECKVRIDKRSQRCSPCNNTIQNKRRVGAGDFCQKGHVKTEPRAYNNACRVCRKANASNRYTSFTARCKGYLGNTCKDCGLDDERVLVFDHLPLFSKVDNIARLGTHDWGVVSKELDKCELVCANCHLIRTKARLLVPTSE